MAIVEVGAPAQDNKQKEVDETSEGSSPSHAERIADARKVLKETRDVDSHVKAAGQLTASFDAQWEEFKKKFDDLSKMAVQKILGNGAPDANLRPAAMISESRVAQVLFRAQNVVVLTGAGVSAESGIPTFRGADGFWTAGSRNYRPQELATWEKYDEMPEELWRWYQYRWGICRKAKPNAGHHALVGMEECLANRMTLVTQNIDGLHRQAGSSEANLCEIHGRIDQVRCDEKVKGSCLYGLNLDDPEHVTRVRACVQRTPAPAKEESKEKLPVCSACGVRQRPKILWFDECYNEAFYRYTTVKKKMETCDVLFIIGTMLTTGGPAQMVRQAQEAGAIIIRMDPEVDLKDEASAGMLHVQGKSGEVLPRILADLRTLQKEEETMAPLVTAGSRQSSKATDRSKASPATGAATSPSAAGSAAAAVRSQSTGVVARRGSSSRSSSSTSHLQSVASAARTGAGSGARGAGQRSLRSPSPAAPAPGSLATKPRPTVGPVNEKAVGFFVYGTLRPDDDSGASWTQKFQENMKPEAAEVAGASLYVAGSYPAVCLENTRCSVRGCLLTPMGKNAKEVAKRMEEKLAEADAIEGYPDLYQRAVVHVQLASGKTAPAYVYHRTETINREECPRVADGDWMSRRRQ